MSAWSTPGPASNPRQMLDLAELYRHHRAYVRACLLSCHTPAAAVDDAVQDVFLVLFRRVDDYDASRGSLRAWLFGISLRVARRHRRAHGRAVAMPNPLAADDAVADPERYTSRLQAADLADRILDRLPREQLSVLVLSDIEQLSGPEIARTLHLELGTVYSRLSRARKRVRREVKAHRRALGLEATPWLAGLVADVRRGLRPARPGLQAAAFVSVRTLQILLVVAGAAAAVAAMLALRERPEPSEPPPAVADAPTLAPDRWARGLTGSDQQVLQHRTTSIAGAVRHVDGGAVGGAQVCAWIDSDLLAVETRAPTCTRSDPSGHYQLDHLMGSRYRVTATAARMQPGQHEPDDDRVSLLLRRGERRRDVDITLRPGGVELRGHVADVTGGAVEGALIMLRDYRRGSPLHEGNWGVRPPVMVQSDADGRFSTWVRGGDVEVLATADGYAESRTRAVAPGLTVALVLTPESTIRGRVVDRSSGGEIAQAKVVVNRGSGRSDDVVVTYTDDEGRFLLAGLRPGRYKPRASAPGRQGDAGISFDLGLGESRDEVVIELVAAPTVTGRIVIDDGDQPCPSGAVVLRKDEQAEPTFAVSDADGWAVFEAVMPGTYDVLVLCTGYASPIDSPSLTIDAEDRLDLRWSVRAGQTISGRIVDAQGRPVAEATAEAHAAGPAASRMPMFTRTGADGAFALAGATPGAYSVQVSHERLGSIPHVEVTVVEGASPAPLELVLNATGVIEGRVRDAEGDGKGGMTVWLAEGVHASTVTLDDGSFRFEGLSPKRYQVFVERGADEKASAFVTLGADQTARLELTLPMHDGEISGVVVDADGAPARDAIITTLADAAAEGPRSLPRLRAAAGFGRGRAPVLTDDDGHFRVSVRPGQTYTVLAQRRGGGDAIARSVAEGAVVRLEIPASASLGGTIATADGKAPAALSVTLRNTTTGEVHAESFSFNQGGFRFDQLGAGHYALVASATEGRLRHELELEPGEERLDLRLSLVSGLTVRGRVVDLQSGAPVSGMIVVAGAPDAGIGEFAKNMERSVMFASEGHRTGDDGRFELHDVPPGKIRLAVLSEKIGDDAYGSALFPMSSTGGGPVAELAPLTVAMMPGGKDVAHIPPGFGFDQDSAPWCTNTTVTVVTPDGPAARAGVVVGDVIEAVGGHDVTGARCHLAQRLALLAPGVEVRVTLARGEDVVLTASPAAAPSAGPPR